MTTTTSNSAERPAERLLSARDITTHFSLSRSTLWRQTRSGDFPQPVQIGLRRIAWLESDVLRWLDKRPTGRMSDASLPKRSAKKEGKK